MGCILPLPLLEIVLLLLSPLGTGLIITPLTMMSYDVAWAESSSDTQLQEYAKFVMAMQTI